MKNIIVGFILIMLIAGCGEIPLQETQPFTAPEVHRPQFHFTPPSMWMNDPNGMVYYEGEYHLFYQHYPDSTVWGPMHWGHAVSRDLVHWEHLPIALFPDRWGYIFSGSAVIDWNNTSGLGTKDNPPMVAIFTYHSAEGERAGRIDYQTQGIAYSLNNGRTWTKYEDNPVLKNPGIRDFRDPKVTWYEEEQKWVMALAVSDHISFYSSQNLIDWQHESDFGSDIGAHGGVWECPDLFKMTVEGSGKEKWVLLVSINPGAPYGGSGTQYFVGHFDGTTFELDDQFRKEIKIDTAGSQSLDFKDAIWIDYGADNYAGVTWSDIPKEDGRRLFIGWMSNWLYANVVPTENWRSAMTIPRNLTLENTADGLRLISKPVREVEKLKTGDFILEAQTVKDSLLISKKLPFSTSTYELKMELESTGNEEFAIELSNKLGQKVSIGFDPVKKAYFIDRRKSGSGNFSKDFLAIHYGPRIAEGSNYDLHLLVDVASVELFADDGKTVMTDIFFPDEEFTNIKLIVNGDVQLNSGTVIDLKSIWNVP